MNAESYADKEKEKTMLKNIINQIDRCILLGAFFFPVCQIY